MSENVAKDHKTLVGALEALLPDILKPDIPLKGNQIIDEVKDQVGCRWEPETIRYHLTIMSSNPSSCVAKYFDDNGTRKQGFVLRPFQERIWDKDKQRMAFEVIERSKDLDNALRIVGDTHVSFWSRVAAAQADLNEAVLNFNTVN